MFHPQVLVSKLVLAVEKSIGYIISAIDAFRNREIDCVVERLFRFIEMTFVAALVGFAYGVVDQTWGRILTVILTILAGAYLGAPLGRRLQKGKSSVYGQLFAIVGCGCSAALIVLPLQSLISATFQINEDRAVQEYARIQGKMAAEGCFRQGTRPFEECEAAARRAEREILEEHGTKGL